jgi:ATP-dependent Lon protease
MEVIRLSGYTEGREAQHRQAAPGSKQIQRNGLKKSEITIEDSAPRGDSLLHPRGGCA